MASPCARRGAARRAVLGGVLGGMDELDCWLEAAGLSDHAPTFRAQKITPDQLRALTDADLRELGLPLGDRLRFRRALPGEAPPARTGARRDAAERSAPERRPLTVVFLDLVDSTGLSARVEPEDLADALRRYQEACVAPIHRFGGRVEQFLGDGVLAYFGYPAAHEDDPERAVRACLAAVSAVSRLAAPGKGGFLAARAGVATGLVLAGDALGAAGKNADPLETAASSRALGSTPNLAARLQGLAPPEGVVVSAETALKLRGRFSMERIGGVLLRGFAEPVEAFRVLAEHAAGTGRRFPGARTAFVNREAELGALSGRWAETLAGRGGAVLLRGGAGMGKSRLARHFLAGRLAREVSAAVVVCASPFHVDDPLRPVASALRVLARAGPGGARAARPGAPDRLRRLLEADRAPEAGPLLTAALENLLGTAGPRDAALLAALPPGRLRVLTFDAVARMVLRAEEDRPLLILVEDAHWLDPTTLALAGRVAAEARTRRTMVLLTARDGFDLPAEGDWRNAAPATVELRGLPAHDSARLLAALCGPLPAATVRELSGRSGGVPLFLEEFARVVAEGAGGRAPDGAVPAIPATLREGLAARLDSAGPSRALAQVAAVLGSEGLRVGHLAAVARCTEAEVAADLDRLEAAGVLRARADAAVGAPSWGFRHALLREAAYESLPRERRRLLHDRAADVLAAAKGAGEPALLAHHLLEAGRAEEAVPFFAAAARRSLAQSALEEAGRLLRRALAALAPLGDALTIRERRLELMALLGPALVGLHGAGSPEAQALYTEAVELSRTLPPSDAHFPVLFGWWRLALARDFHESEARAAALHILARGRRDRGLLLQAHHCGWPASLHRGDLCGCERHVRAGLRFYDPALHAEHASLYGNHDAKVCGLAHAALSLWQRGAAGSGFPQMARAVGWARRLGHVGSLVHAHEIAATLRVFGRDPDRVAAAARRLSAHAETHGYDDQRARAKVLAGWVMGKRGEARNGAALAAEGLAAVSTTEDFPVFHCMVAETLAAAGDVAGAVERLGAARKEFRRVGLRFWLPEVSRTLGELLLRSDPTAVDAAAAAFDEAWKEADEQGAGRLALRAALAGTCLARRESGGEALRLALHRLGAARRLVSAPGSDDADLRTADALLAALPWPVPADARRAVAPSAIGAVP